MALNRSLSRVILAGLAAFAVGLAGCASQPRATDFAGLADGDWPETAQPPDQLRAQVVFTAMQMVGVPYRWGGSSPDGFDCSGLVQFAYSNAGLRLPRTAAEQLEASTPVPLETARAGDLLFFRDGSRTSHVAIYLGAGRFVHAPSTGNRVSLDSFGNAYWRMHFARAGRVATAS
ncbi:MAG: C40 family peptidase [Gammaproteobacteria bacterium]